MRSINNRFMRVGFIIIFLIISSLLVSNDAYLVAAPSSTEMTTPILQDDPLPQTLSPIWDTNIQQWAKQIIALSDVYGLDPDFIASVVKEESNGRSDGVSPVGAVGLMGVMPSGPGLEWRPTAEALIIPTVNLRWGVAILSEIVRQSGGDLYSALAAYSGGWLHVDDRVPREYAASVLNNYGRAIVTRSGTSPDIASQWTIAIQMRRGYVTNESLLVLGDQPVSGLLTYGEHIIYDYVDQSGRAYYVRGYAVPVALVVPLGKTNSDHDPSVDGTTVELELQSRLGETDIKIANHNPRVILACLPSLGRLRGRVSTRWFAPSNCPSWHR
ncbi:MAG: lytic transglycosylase domain-containing protein [Chloroflexi bacterium]|nr:lytic transglycosylase domain-containing protein [Chloroflexota bacterium]